MSRFLDLKHAESAYEALVDANQRNIDEASRLRVRATELEVALKNLLSALEKNHKWHEENDKYEGYADSELIDTNTAAISSAYSLLGKDTKPMDVDITDEPDYTSRHIYLKKGDEPGVIGLHEVGFMDGDQWVRMESWGNQYDDDGKFKYSAFRIFGPIDEDATSMKEDGWVEVPCFDEKVNAAKGKT